jgi:3-oxoacyl-[acyl-carrier protein] reductase
MFKNALDFTGKTVLITGGSSGIGNGIARAFRDCGAKVVITGTRASSADYEDTDCEGMKFFQLDVGDDKAVEAFDPGIDQLDVLVNSAGTVAYKRQEYEMATFRRVMDVNIMGMMHMCTRFHPMLVQTRGCIVNVTSVASFRSTPGNPAYSASKGGGLTLTRTLANAWGRNDVRVNAILPGLVDTKLTKVTRDNPELYEASIKRTPLRRWGTPEEMGGIALFLASPLLSGFVTGEGIVADGGANV